MESFAIAEVVFSSVPVRGGTRWYFVELSDRDGVTGTAEFTFGERSMDTAAAIAQMAGELRGEPIEDESSLTMRLGLSDEFLERDRVMAAAASALRTAVLDGQAQRAGLPLWEFLGGGGRRRGWAVELYGNINRSMLPNDDGPVDRSPAAFAEAASRAVDDGFRAVKCAPFDECRAPYSSNGLPPEARPGLERISAVREAIGPDVDLFVDCHSRFDLESALALAPELAARGVEWFEEPVSYREHPEALKQIREAASMKVAGAEDGYGAALFCALIDNVVVDVVMPDVKYCGGAGEAVAIGRAIEAVRSGSLSMHSPAGPVSMLASAHATAAFGGTRPLEHAIGEVDWRATVIEPAEEIEDGIYRLPPGPGLGAGLNQSLIDAIGRRWTM